MTKTLEGQPIGKGVRVGIVASRFNATVTDKLLEGAIDTLQRLGCSSNDIFVVRVPGAFEIPVAARELASTGRFAALVCVGCVVRGETPHFDHICAQTTRGISQVMRDFRIPVGFGVLTVNTLEQALDRAGKRFGNKGSEAAEVALEMADLFARLRRQEEP